MASLQDMLKANQKKGWVKQEEQNFPALVHPNQSAVKVLDAHMNSAPSRALSLVASSVEGFANYWEEQLEGRDVLDSPSAYIGQINELVGSYLKVRRRFDTSVAFLVGEWLLSCRERFFPKEDRKSRGEWSRFLEENLCDGFEKSTAYLYMSFASNLSELKNYSLPIKKMEALLKLKKAGKSIDGMLANANELSVDEILSALNVEPLKVDSTPYFVKLVAILQSLQNRSDAFADLKENQRLILQVQLKTVLSLLEKKI